MAERSSCMRPTVAKRPWLTPPRLLAEKLGRQRPQDLAFGLCSDKIVGGLVGGNNFDAPDNGTQ